MKVKGLSVNMKTVEQALKNENNRKFSDDDYDWVDDKLNSIKEYDERAIILERPEYMSKSRGKKVAFLKLKNAMDEAKKNNTRVLCRNLWNEID